MQERLKQIPEKTLEFWNKYTSKQKTVIICVIAAIFFTIVLLTYFFTKPNYDTQLAAFEDNKGATDLIAVLEENGIGYKQSRDGKIVYVQDEDYTMGLNLMSENEILSDEFSWEEALNNDMSTTQSEKNQKILLASQNELRNYVMKVDGVKDATVYLDMPEEDYTIFSENQEASVSIMLSLTEEMTEKQAESIAMWVANAVGNKTTDNVVIMDTARNLLYGGSKEDALGGAVSDKEEYKEKLTNQIKLNVEEVLTAYGFDNVKVGSANIVFDFDEIEERYTEYTPAEGQEQGVYSSSYNYSASGTSGSGGIPGTDSNDAETDYMIEDSGTADSKVTLEKYNYLPNERIQTIKYETGAVKPEESSMAVVLTNIRTYNEEDLERQGLLDNMTFEDYVDANNERIRIELDEDVVALVAATTGIAEEQISVVAWEQPIFNAKEETPMDVTNLLMIILAVLIVALLLFVVFKGTKPVEVTEMEPELSVEQLLATTKENQSLEDIEFSEKSETRRMIEKFVDENPEAVASLLRNWLQDDWG